MLRIALRPRGARQGSGARDVRSQSSRPPSEPEGRRPIPRALLAATFGNSGSTPDRGEDDYHNPKEGWQAGEVPPEKTENTRRRGDDDFVPLGAPRG